MRSPINWALLGLVIQRPSYGYELVQRFERTYEDALELSSPSQVYTALDALSAQVADRGDARGRRGGRRATPAQAPLPGHRRGRARLPGLAGRPAARGAPALAAVRAPARGARRRGTRSS